MPYCVVPAVLCSARSCIPSSSLIRGQPEAVGDVISGMDDMCRTAYYLGKIDSSGSDGFSIVNIYYKQFVLVAFRVKKINKTKPSSTSSESVIFVFSGRRRSDLRRESRKSEGRQDEMLLRFSSKTLSGSNWRTIIKWCAFGGLSETLRCPT